MKCTHSLALSWPYILHSVIAIIQLVEPSFLLFLVINQYRRDLGSKTLITQCRGGSLQNNKKIQITKTRECNKTGRLFVGALYALLSDSSPSLSLSPEVRKRTLLFFRVLKKIEFINSLKMVRPYSASRYLLLKFGDLSHDVLALNPSMNRQSDRSTNNSNENYGL